jgi:hypothetical protein
MEVMRWSSGVFWVGWCPGSGGGGDGGLRWCFSWSGVLSWHARKGGVCRHSVLTEFVVLSYSRDVLVIERW